MWTFNTTVNSTHFGPRFIMMTRIFWDTVFLISGSFFTFGAGQRSSSIIEANISFDTNSTSAANTSINSPVTTGSREATIMSIPAVNSSLFTFEGEPTNTTFIDGIVSINNTSSAADSNTTSRSQKTSRKQNAAPNFIAATTSNVRPAKIPITTPSSTFAEFVAAAVRFHFDDCPDTHRHFCFHGTCRFLILEETPACVCHPGFVGMRCEHADLLAVVATNHRQQTVATVLVLCVIGCVLIMVLCTLLHCWWRRDSRRRSRAHHYITEKHGVSCYPSESVV